MQIMQLYYTGCILNQTEYNDKHMSYNATTRRFNIIRSFLSACFFMKPEHCLIVTEIPIHEPKHNISYACKHPMSSSSPRPRSHKNNIRPNRGVRFHHPRWIYILSQTELDEAVYQTKHRTNLKFSIHITIVSKSNSFVIVEHRRGQFLFISTAST